MAGDLTKIILHRRGAEDAEEDKIKIVFLCVLCASAVRFLS